MEFDDPNQTGYPYDSLTIVAGTDVYDIQTDSNSDVIYTVHKVVFNKKDIPRVQFTEGNQEAMLDTTDTAITPTGYYDLGKAIKFKEIPSVGGTATIYYEREHHYIVTGDTSLVPGLPLPYHLLAAKRVGRNWARSKTLPNMNALNADVQEQEELLGLFEESRRGDEGAAMTVTTVNGR